MKNIQLICKNVKAFFKETVGLKFLGFPSFFKKKGDKIIFVLVERQLNVWNQHRSVYFDNTNLLFALSKQKLAIRKGNQSKAEAAVTCDSDHPLWIQFDYEWMTLLPLHCYCHCHRHRVGVKWKEPNAFLNSKRPKPAFFILLRERKQEIHNSCSSG